MNKRMQFTPGTTPLLTAMNNIKNVGNGGLDLQPDYQRGFIWSSEFKNKLIYSVIKKYPIGSVSIRELNSKNSKGALQEVVDGQQRLTTLYNFIYNEYRISGEMTKAIAIDICDYLKDNKDDKKLIALRKKLNNKGGFTLKYNDLPEIIKDNIQAYPLATVNISYSSEEEIAEYFRFLQNQEVLRAGEIINSIPETHLQKYLDKVQDIDKLMDILGYSNNRKEFDKLFYSIIGLYDKQINFGTTNKCIKEYVFNKKTDLEGDALTQTLKMINNLNKVLDVECKFKANKRFIKMLLLLAGFEAIDFNDNLGVQLKKLDKINNMLSSFNSAERDIVNKTFVGFSDKEIEEYRLIALFNKGAQTYRITQERIFSLADKIHNEKKILI